MLKAYFTTVCMIVSLLGYSQNSVQGHFRGNGTYVDPYQRTSPNTTNWDNYSTKGNTNPYSGSSGTRARDYSYDAGNYGQGQSINTGPKGGQYYYNDNGNKVYVPKRPRSGNSW